VIERVRIGSREHAVASGPIEAPPGDRLLEISFTAPYFVDSELTGFRYRLRGLSEDWIDGNTERVARFPELRPGRYVFEVIALGPDGQPSERATVLPIVLRPFFHETTWFRGLLLAGVLMLVGWGMFSRVRRMRRHSVELERQVADRTAELRYARDHLQQIVQRRTAELTAAIDKLRQDMERRQTLERELRESQKLEAIGRLAGGLAHDFNNILTAVLTQTDLLLCSLDDASEDDQERRQGLDMIRDSGERAALLTRQLLAYSRQSMLAPVVLQPNDAIRALERMLRRLVRADIALRLELDPATGHVFVDPTQFDQIVINLVVNASQACGDSGGTVTIRTMHAGSAPPAPDLPDVGDHVLISVSDTGSGIDEAIIDHVFEPFFTTKGRGQGTGLGLASVHGIVEQSGGFVRVRSAPAEGTTFWIYLPQATRNENATTPDSPTAPAVGPAPHRPGATVLLCDDEPDIRRVAARCLADVGYRVLSTESPEHALQLGREHAAEIDLLVTDLVMPGMHGTELAQQLRAERDGLRVLYISGYSPEMFADGSPQDGTSTHFLYKPFDSRTLLRRVGEILVG
jgi:signal transduction histidine kinase